MRRMNLCLLLVALSLLGGCANPKPRAISSSVTDLQGHAANPLDLTGRRAVVLLFITNDCPISNAYAPEIHRLCNTFASQKIEFYLVYSDPALSAADARVHYRDYGYTCPAVLDPKHELARRAGATVTPEAAVFVPGDKEVYRGRINDLYVDYGKARFQPTTNDLRDVLQQIASGETVTPSTTVAIGCHIPM